ncbi:MAG: hypothetical protein M3332_18550, partial [Actinomycetota bacterium]|nr:hypothetical protein [Actinomycetota bacterium]
DQADQVAQLVQGLGRELPGMLCGAGLVNVGIDAHIACGAGDLSQKLLLQSSATYDSRSSGSAR